MNVSLSSSQTRSIGGEQYRHDPFMRFSVKCTRDQNRYLTEMAANIGMTPNELVQSAMDALLVDYEPDKKAKSSSAGWNESISADMVNRVLKALVARMDPSGRVTLAVAELCREIGISGNTLYRATRVMTKDGRVERVQDGGVGRPAIFQIKKALE